MSIRITREIFFHVLLASFFVSGISALTQGFSNYQRSKHSLKEKLKSYRWDQIKFGTTSLFRFAMAQKASDNLVGSLTFTNELTECVLLGRENKILARFSDCNYRYDLSQIPEGFSNYGDFIALRTDFENERVIHVL